MVTARWHGSPYPSRVPGGERGVASRSCPSGPDSGWSRPSPSTGPSWPLRPFPSSLVQPASLVRPASAGLVRRANGPKPANRVQRASRRRSKYLVFSGRKRGFYLSSSMSRRTMGGAFCSERPFSAEVRAAKFLHLLPISRSIIESKNSQFTHHQIKRSVHDLRTCIHTE